MAKVVKEGRIKYWVDGEGVKIPEKRVSKDEKLREEMMDVVFAKVIALQQQMAENKREINLLVHKYLDQIADQYDEKWQGNAKLKDFGEQREISIKISKTLKFDERVQVAKKKIDNCIVRWSGNANSNLVALVNRAFNVNQDNSLNIREILSLQRLEVDDNEWNEAMEIIKDSIIVSSSKEYIMFRQREEAGDWQTLHLNFAKL